MKIYSKETVQHVTASLDECWSSPRNLQKITPTDMGLKSQIMMVISLSRPSNTIQSTPTFWNHLTWMTVITAVKENSYFIDEQRFGPYALWHHKHFLKLLKRCKMTDVVHALPLGFRSHNE
jgi:hypothetical protein